MTAFYPVFLDVRGRRAVVIGGGAVAEQKVLGLLDASARVIVVSPETTPRLDELAGAGAIELLRRSYRAGDLAGAWLAIAATDDRAVNAAVWAEAEQRGVPLNAVDDLDHCSFIAPAIHRAGDITVAVSTAGKSPALAVRLRERIARLVDRAEARLCELLGELRPELAARVPDARARTALWYRIVDSDVIDFVRRDDVNGARRRVEELVREPGGSRETGVVYLVGAGPGDPGLITVQGLEVLRSAEVVVYDRLVGAPGTGERANMNGKVYLVGAGPGDPQLLTLKALRVLESADVVLHDELVSAEILALAPARARLHNVGKRCGQRRTTQEEINALLMAHASDGRTVVRLKGGDPLIFGRAGEEMEALREAGIDFEIIPGVTAAMAAAASARIPLTDRRLSSKLIFLTGHPCAGKPQFDWKVVGAPDATAVLYMPGSDYDGLAAGLREAGFDGQTPCMIVSCASTPQEQIHRTALGKLPQAPRFPAPVVLIIGMVAAANWCTEAANWCTENEADEADRLITAAGPREQAFKG